MSWESLLSGAVGGALLLLLQTAYSWWDARRRRAKDLEGLLTLLFFEEIVPNTKLAEALLEDPSSVVAEKITIARPLAKTALWETSRGRVAELTDDGLLIGRLASFYGSVDGFKFSLDLEQPPERRKEHGLGRASLIKQNGDVLIQHVKKIIVKPD